MLVATVSATPSMSTISPLLVYPKCMFMIVGMREVNIAGVDLNLVPALDALLRRRSLTRAAAAVGLSPPAMSRCLARLRDVQGDPLLVRSPDGYVLTARAQALRPLLASAMNQLRDVFRQQDFDPGTERGVVRLAAADTHTILILPGVAARLAVEAPGVDLLVEPYRRDTSARLNDGSLDLAFALSTTPLRSGTYSEAVAEDRLALVMRRGHPAARHAWSIADYGSHQHVDVDVLGDGQSQIDSALATRGIGRRVVLWTPHFMAALAVVAATDLVTTVSSAFARRFAPVLDLVLHAPPFDETRLEVTLVYSHARASDPLLAWFRTLVRDVALTSNLGVAVPRQMEAQL